VSRYYPTRQYSGVHPQPIRAAQPSPDQPGSLYQMFDALGLFGQNPARFSDREHSWELALRLSLPHRRRGAQ
jgi:hypothetical protein